VALGIRDSFDGLNGERRDKARGVSPQLQALIWVSAEKIWVSAEKFRWFRKNHDTRDLRS